MYEALNKNFVHRRSLFTEKQLFRAMRRKEGELVKTFITRLRAQACKRNYGTADKEELLNQLFSGSEMRDFQMKCIQEDTITLEGAVRIAEGLE